MATKAEKYRADQQRANQADKPKKAKPKSEPGEHKAGVEGTAARNSRLPLLT
jgi:hypothetical protein